MQSTRSFYCGQLGQHVSEGAYEECLGVGLRPVSVNIVGTSVRRR
jgi:hypothetical protein